MFFIVIARKIVYGNDREVADFDLSEKNFVKS